MQSNQEISVWDEMEASANRYKSAPMIRIKPVPPFNPAPMDSREGGEEESLLVMYLVVYFSIILMVLFALLWVISVPRT